MRDPNRLRVFHVADALVVDVYNATRGFPDGERFGLQTQMRRAAVSAVCNIVEGAGRRSSKEYAHFLSMASGSTFEIRYLLNLAHRLGFLGGGAADDMTSRYTELAKGLHRLIDAVGRSLAIGLWSLALG